MFGDMQGMMGQLQLMQKLMKDENFQAFISHPKIQELFKDPEFKEIAQTKDFQKILTQPKFAALIKDPELAALLAKIDFQGLKGA